MDAFSEAESTVVKATGASGAALDGLTTSMMNAYAASKSGSLDDTAGAIGEINTRMGLTGDALTTVTGQFLDFAESTGTNVVGSVQSVTKIMNKWNVESSEVESVLDKLAYAGQVSGISVDSLASTVTNSSATFQALGMNPVLSLIHIYREASVDDETYFNVGLQAVDSAEKLYFTVKTR